MALELKLNYKSISDDCKTVTIEDITGSYNANNNQGGYGGGINPDRNTLALFLLVDYFDGSSLVDMSKLEDNPDPENAVEWNFEQTYDGWYRTTLAAMPLYNAGTIYSNGEFAYENDKIYRSRSDNNQGNPVTAGTFWEEISFQTFVTAEAKQGQANLVEGLLDITVSCRAANCYAKATIALTEGILVTDCNCSDENSKDWQRAHVLYNGAITLSLQQRFSEADKVLKALADICEELDCECGC